jgi:hypothetical protein
VPSEVHLHCFFPPSYKFPVLPPSYKLPVTSFMAALLMILMLEANNNVIINEKNLDIKIYIFSVVVSCLKKPLSKWSTHCNAKYAFGEFGEQFDYWTDHTPNIRKFHFIFKQKDLGWRKVIYLRAIYYNNRSVSVITFSVLANKVNKLVARDDPGCVVALRYTNTSGRLVILYL